MTGKKALVTGGVRGIGFFISKFLVDRGVEVIATTRKENEPSPVPGVRTYRADLSDPASVEKIVSDLRDCDILINNAGHMNGFSLDQYDEEKLKYIMNVNLIVPVNLMWALGQKMAERGGGRIVNNASIAAHTGHPDFWYGATKAGLLNATKSMARAMGQKGIVCNAVGAGPVCTDMLEVIPEPRRNMMKANSILGRFAEPEEVAQAIVWLALDSPVYINGVSIDINNGSFMR